MSRACSPRCFLFSTLVFDKLVGWLVTLEMTSFSSLSLFKAMWSAKKKQLNQLQKRWKTLQKSYCETISITNDGEFVLNLDFKWQHDGCGEFKPMEDGQDATRPDAKSPAPVYFVEPPSLEIQKGNTGSFTIWCFPSSGGTFTDILECQIANNPTPMTVTFQSSGCVPQIELSTNKIEFDRQICGSDSLQQNITLKNTSLVSAKWNLSPTELENMPQEFKFSKLGGTIQANKKDTICVSFTSSETEKQVSHSVHLNVLDTRSIQGNTANNANVGGAVKDKAKKKGKGPDKASGSGPGFFSSEAVELSGESFQMLHEIDIANSHLDFGVVKVNSKSVQKFSIQNNGKYALKFKLISSGKAAIRKLVKSSLSITPSTGSIEPGDKVEIVLVFQSKIEIEPLEKIQALKLHIIEDTKDCVYESIPIRISISCVYAKFHTVPQSTINLGSVELLKSRTKSLELYNDGDFDLEYEIVTSLEQLELKTKQSVQENDTEEKAEDDVEAKGMYIELTTKL